MKELHQKAQAVDTLRATLRQTATPLELLGAMEKSNQEAIMLAGVANVLADAERLLDGMQNHYRKRIAVLQAELYGAKGAAQAAIANARTQKSLRLVISMPDTKCDLPHIAQATVEAAMRFLGTADRSDLIALAGYEVAVIDARGYEAWRIKSIYYP